MNFIIITKGERNSTNILLTYINQLRSNNIYTLVIREHVSKKVKFGTAMFMAKISIQVVIIEDVTSKLIRMLTQFIMKYYRSIGLSLENTKNLTDIIS